MNGKDKGPPTSVGVHLADVGAITQVVWLRHFFGSDVVAALTWLGLRPLPATAGALEDALRVKVLILISIAFKRRSAR